MIQSQKKVKVANEVTVAKTQRDKTKGELMVEDKKEEMGAREVPSRRIISNKIHNEMLAKAI